MRTAQFFISLIDFLVKKPGRGRSNKHSRKQSSTAIIDFRFSLLKCLIDTDEDQKMSFRMYCMAKSARFPAHASHYSTIFGSISDTRAFFFLFLLTFFFVFVDEVQNENFRDIHLKSSEHRSLDDSFNNDKSLSVVLSSFLFSFE